MELEISSFKRILFLTGSGISADSGISTFRDSDGLWEKHRIEDVATPEAFERDPLLVWRFYSQRRRAAAGAKPNPAHIALARLSRLALERGLDITLVTQNVDGLHEKALCELDRETKNTFSAPDAGWPFAMHGTLSRSRCVACDRIYLDSNAWFTSDGEPSSDPQDELGASAGADPTIEPSAVTRDSAQIPLSPCCRRRLRPHIVWFGEMPLHLDEIQHKLSSCELFVTVGTRGQVYPAAGFIAEAKAAGAVTVCLNKEPIPQRGVVDFYLEGPAAEVVPRFLRGLLI